MKVTVVGAVMMMATAIAVAILVTYLSHRQKSFEPGKMRPFAPPSQRE